MVGVKKFEHLLVLVNIFLEGDDFSLRVNNFIVPVKGERQLSDAGPIVACLNDISAIDKVGRLYFVSAVPADDDINPRYLLCDFFGALHARIGKNYEYVNSVL